MCNKGVKDLETQNLDCGNTVRFQKTLCMPLYSNYTMALTSGIVGSPLWEEDEQARAKQKVRPLSLSHTQTHARACMFKSVSNISKMA
jgi:hypothetical protein